MAVALGEEAVSDEAQGLDQAEGETVAEVGRQIFEEILQVASGKKTRSEVGGVGEEEFAPWSIGPTL